MPIDHSDIDIDQRIRLGDRAAFQSFFEKHWNRIYQSIYLLVKQVELAEDIAQDVFVKLWDKREKLEGVANLKSYLFLMARNAAIDHLRRKTLVPENIDYLITYFQDRSPSPQQAIEYKELREILDDAINQLPPKLKEVFLWSRHEGLSHADIAERKGISVVSSKTYIVRSLKFIREYLHNHMDDSLLLFLLVILSEKK